MKYTKASPSQSTTGRLADGVSLLNERVNRHRDLLLGLAAKYVWWLSAEESMEFPARVIAQVMNIGVFDDVGRLLDSIGEDGLRTVLQQAEAGQFNGRSWHYWHYRLGLAEPNLVPPLPIKHIPPS
jgi:hypothetical protein